MEVKMEISKIQNGKGDKYIITDGLYKGFVFEKATEGKTSIFTVTSAKNVFEKNEKLTFEITKPNSKVLNEKDISDTLIRIIAGDALDGLYDSLPAIPKEFWLKKMLPEFFHRELKKQAKGKDFGDAFTNLCNTMDAMRKASQPVKISSKEKL